jgi:signal transduction histidine kinase
MNDPPESTCLTDASVEYLNGHATHVEPGYLPDVGFAGITHHSTELADRLRIWPMWRVPGQKLRPDEHADNEFLAVFSHELRSSLGAIRSAVGILRMEVSAGPAAVNARLLIERQVGQMTRLIEDLLDVSRVRCGQLRLERERIDLRAVVAHSVQTVEFTMQQRRHRMTTSLPDSPVWLLADPTRLEQVFVNLLVNAAKYTDAGGEVDLSVERGDREAIIRVRDTGIGIAPDVLPTVFDLFVQADPAQRAEAGLGIGLALVRSLVEAHGGRVTAASAGLRWGSEFVVRLPAPHE